MKFRVRYRRARVTVEGTKPENCEACPRSVKDGWKVGLHHYVYAYKTSEVIKNPQLALNYTIAFCYSCHQLADIFRKIMVDRERAGWVESAINMKITQEEDKIRR